RIPCKTKSRSPLPTAVRNSRRIVTRTAEREVSVFDNINYGRIAGVRSWIVLSFRSQAIGERKPGRDAPGVLSKKCELLFRKRCNAISYLDVVSSARAIEPAKEGIRVRCVSRQTCGCDRYI